MAMEWNRPESIPYPNTWKKFKGLREINGKIPEFWMQDVTEDQIETIVDSMVIGFVNEEPLCKYSKFAEDQISLAEAVGYYRYILINKLTVVCMTNGSEGKPKVVGISCLQRITKDDPSLEPTGDVFSRMKSLQEYVYGVKNPFTHFGITELMEDKGIYVLPEYRGQGLCFEFLKTWPIICKAVGLKAVIGTFTSIASQKVADRAGFQELNSFSYVELGKLNSKFLLPGIEEHTKNLRLLYVTV